MDLKEQCINLLNDLMDGIEQGDFSKESIPEKYTYAYLYAVFNLLDELKGADRLYEQVFDLAVKCGTAEISRKCARGEKIKIAFLVISAAEWGLEKVYRMLEQDDRVECYIVVSPLVDRDLESRRDTYLQTVGFFEKNGYEVRGGCNEEFNVPVSWQEMGGMPDIVMHSTPWIQSMPVELQIINFPLMTLNYYMAYGIHVSDGGSGLYVKEAVYNNEFVNMMMHIYADSERDVRGYQEYGLLHGKNILYSGYAKMDFFYENRVWSEDEIRKLWQIPDGIKCQDMKRVIIAPHHSISESSLIKYATFQKNVYFLIYLAKKYCNEVSFVFKPHPNLRLRAVEEKVFDSYEAYDAYLEEWNSLPNAKVVQESDYLAYFDTSDGMIMDSSSFLAEYMYVHKPLLFLLREGQEFNPLGKILLEADYTAKGEDYAEIEKFLQEVIINGNDVLSDKRQQIFDAELDYMKRSECSASEYIYKDIVSLF
ncbi:MAG: CDP-glycerol glycerophosphotransferase family protein [Lachnospiraceae bacterium]|nr:CDP-glycerol glycerophosphotransferase family protein [Lachnospiraceae bacterium]